MNPTHHTVSPPHSGCDSEPSIRELLLLCSLTCVFFVTFISFCRAYSAAVDNFGDSSAYITLASAIRHWSFRGIVVKQFWGLPYAMAALSYGGPDFGSYISAGDQRDCVLRRGDPGVATLGRLDRRLLRHPEFRLAAAFVPGRLRSRYS